MTMDCTSNSTRKSNFVSQSNFLSLKSEKRLLEMDMVADGNDRRHGYHTLQSALAAPPPLQLSHSLHLLRLPSIHGVLDLISGEMDEAGGQVRLARMAAKGRTKALPNPPPQLVSIELISLPTQQKSNMA